MSSRRYMYILLLLFFWQNQSVIAIDGDDDYDYYYDDDKTHSNISTTLKVVVNLMTQESLTLPFTVRSSSVNEFVFACGRCSSPTNKNDYSMIVLKKDNDVFNSIVNTEGFCMMSEIELEPSINTTTGSINIKWTKKYLNNATSKMVRDIYVLYKISNEDETTFNEDEATRVYILYIDNMILYRSTNDNVDPHKLLNDLLKEVNKTICVFRSNGDYDYVTDNKYQKKTFNDLDSDDTIGDDYIDDDDTTTSNMTITMDGNGDDEYDYDIGNGNRDVTTAAEDDITDEDNVNDNIVTTTVNIGSGYQKRSFNNSDRDDDADDTISDDYIDDNTTMDANGDDDYYDYNIGNGYQENSFNDFLDSENADDENLDSAATTPTIDNSDLIDQDSDDVNTDNDDTAISTTNITADNSGLIDLDKDDDAVSNVNITVATDIVTTTDISDLIDDDDNVITTDNSGLIDSDNDNDDDVSNINITTTITTTDIATTDNSDLIDDNVNITTTTVATTDNRGLIDLDNDDDKVSNMDREDDSNISNASFGIVTKNFLTIRVVINVFVIFFSYSCFN